MSGFDRALGALGRRELLECARGLLKVLSGSSGALSGAGPAGGLDGDVARAGDRGRLDAAADEAPGGGFGLAAAGRAGRGAQRVRPGERAARAGSDAAAAAERARGGGDEPDGAERWERYFDTLPPERERAPRGDMGGGAGAAFAGPERRYDSAAGARGMEMSRVSDYFRRDSRRYDAGFTRF